jgi:hypothetical protein
MRAECGTETKEETLGSNNVIYRRQKLVIIGT